MIPLVDLNAQSQALRAESEAAIRQVTARGTFIGGEALQQFEGAFAEYCGAAACVGVGNGTDALTLTLRALGIGPGDEVITVAHTFIATVEAISLVGATPVLIEIRDETMLMDPGALERAITARTRAVIPVHLYGQPCEMDQVLAVARRHQLKVVEDAAQAHGARWEGQRVGVLGDAGCFSFFPAKNLGAYGDGGAVVSQDRDLIRRIRMLANHGRLEKYTHEVAGTNSRLDTLQAAILGVKLRHLDDWNAARRRHAEAYRTRLAKSRLVLPTTHPRAESVWHLFVIRVKDRDRVRQQLTARGIETGIHYPVPVHRQPAYRHLGLPEGTLPVTERVATSILSLPIYPELTTAQIDEVARAVETATA